MTGETSEEMQHIEQNLQKKGLHCSVKQTGSHSAFEEFSDPFLVIDL